MAQLGGKTEMAAAVAIGSGRHLNRAPSDLQNSFHHNFPHNCQHIFLTRARNSRGALLGLLVTAGCVGAGCFDTEYFCTQYFELWTLSICCDDTTITSSNFINSNSK